jgi:hypothetical protein
VWANLVRLAQALLQDSVLEVEEGLGACLLMAGALAEQAAALLPASATEPQTAAAPGQQAQGERAAAGGSSTLSSAAATACQLLEFSAELVEHARQQATQQQQQQQQQQQKKEDASDATVGSSIAQQVADIQQQVLLQLARAHLACGQPGRALSCITTLRGLAAGSRPPPGLQQLSSVALLQHGELPAATTQLCAWLQQGGHATAEACAAVQAFMTFMYACSSSSSSSTPTVAEREAAVQQVAAAAVQHCKHEPDVALQLALQLLAEEVSGCLVGCPVGSLCGGAAVRSPAT